MGDIKKIERAWLENFKKSDLVRDGVFNTELANNLFYGDSEVENEYGFEGGFRDFNFDYRNPEAKLDQLIKYLHFIGITVGKDSIKQAVSQGNYSYKQILKKAFYIFKTLASYNESLNINDPYYDNMGDLFLFLRIEEGNFNSDKQATIFDENELPDLYNKYIEIPSGFEDDDIAMNLFERIENSNESYFITGKAGTGKSTFIHYFTKNTEKSVLLLAFTGIAAINIGGQTINSFFRFPFKPLLPEDEDIPIFRKFYQKRKILKKVDTIVIDEVSMLRSDKLEGLDYSLRQNGGNPSALFGGKQMIFVGDIFQLPPIVRDDNPVEQEVFRSVYKSQYFFDSPSFKELSPQFYEFQKIHRQQNKEFIQLLNQVRDYSVDIEGIKKLNKQYDPNFKPDVKEFVIKLTSNNYIAGKENQRRINTLPYKSHYFKATIIGDFKEDRYPTSPILELKRNAQIMFVRNDSKSNERRWVNGTIAKVEFVADDKIEIKLKDGSIYKIQKETWENRKYQWDKQKGRITSKVIGTFEQYPIKLAWAITIHKSQGLTFDKIHLDLGSGAFANGQLYTALSRCRSMEGLVLKRKIKESDIIVDKRLQAFYNKHLANNSANSMKNKHGVCCYCGKKEKMTDEHVVPKGLYIENHKTVIPVCEKCNNNKAKDDEYFRLVFAVIKESEDHAVAQKVIQKVKRSLNNPKQKGFQSMIKAYANNIFKRDKKGNLVKNTGLKVEVNRINTIFEYIIKGLYYLETGTRLPDQYHVVSTFGREGNSKEGKAKLEGLRKFLTNKSWKEIGEREVFKYRYTSSVENTPQSIWEMKIYNGNSTVALIANKMKTT